MALYSNILQTKLAAEMRSALRHQFLSRYILDSATCASTVNDFFNIWQRNRQLDYDARDKTPTL